MRALAFPLLALAVSGCVDVDSKYPSLLPRPIESTGTAEPPARPEPVATPDPVLDKRIADIVATLDKAQRDFTVASQDAEARIAVARGLPEGSDPWLDAQSALTTLGAARGPVSEALVDLERLAVDRAQEGKPPYPALDAAIARASKLNDDQSARIGLLEGALKP
ncbi:hypothetical protein P1X14_09575 [Sphingomonas sp. AOB5]|uniref:hypothetical protein n=1 Tax=Sphingomonas sp. AOB5 TaxID=3034017 RepID=UPI0023F90EFD|nr:hypothetical protein [Sphingomonas sp. AOB5]MDF7775496.1 hypothetical protein [Sphingomonas sp. AOB5]